MKRRLKRSTRGHIIVSVVCILIFGGAFLTGFFVVTNRLKQNYQSQINTLSQELDSKRIYVYQANKDIKAGSVLTKESLSYNRVLSEQPPENFITESDIGKVLLIDIQSGTEVLKSMLTEDFTDNTLREVEFNSFLLSSNLKENDYVDIRILYPNGDNYVVLSKKNTKNLDLENGRCFMWLDAEEILRVSSAIVDCYLNEGTILYTVKYIEPRIQQASVITYTPNANVIKIIKEDPNIVKEASDKINETLRQDLESRLLEFYSTHGDDGYWYNKNLSTYYGGQRNQGNNPSGNGNQPGGTVEVIDSNLVDEDEEEIYYVD